MKQRSIVIYTSTQLLSILNRIRDRKTLRGPRKLVKRGTPMVLSYDSLNRICKNVKRRNVNYLFETFLHYRYLYLFFIFNI